MLHINGDPFANLLIAQRLAHVHSTHELFRNMNLAGAPQIALRVSPHASHVNYKH